MNNIKCFFIFSMFLLYSIESICSFKLIDKDTAKALSPALVNASKGIGVDAARELAKSNLAASKILSPALVESSRVVGSDAAKALADSNLEIAKIAAKYSGPAIAVMGVGVVAYSVAQLQSIAKDSYYFFYPTEEQKKVDENATREVKYLKAEAKFIDCMISNKPNSEMNKFNRPTACEETAHMLAMCGGHNKVVELTNIFNEYK